MIELRTRRLEILGIAHGGCLGIRYLIHDRDPIFTKEFRDLREHGGVEC